MLRNSLVAAASAFAAVTSSAVPGNAGIAAVNGHPHHRTVVHHVYTLEPSPRPYYYDTYYGPSYAPAAPITALPGAAVCLAVSIIDAC